MTWNSVFGNREVRGNIIAVQFCNIIYNIGELKETSLKNASPVNLLTVFGYIPVIRIFDWYLSFEHFGLKLVKKETKHIEWFAGMAEVSTVNPDFISVFNVT